MDHKEILKQEQDKNRIVEEFLPYDYMAIIDGLVNKGEFSDTNKSISIRTPKDKLPYITIEVLSEFIEPSAEDIETKSLYKEYSIRDFIDILERLQSKKTVEHPKLSVKYKDATFELIDKLLDL